MNFAARLLLIALALGLSGCASSPDPVAPPAKLTDFAPTKVVDSTWQAQLGAGSGRHHVSMGPSHDRGYIYAAARNGLVRAYAAESGRRVWSTELGVPLGTGPVDAGDLLLLGGDAEVIALDRATGALRWRAPVSSEVIAAPVRGGDRVIARTVDGALFALSAADGHRVWRSQEQAVPLLSLRGEGAPIIVVDTVVAGFANGRVAAFDLRDGRLLWESAVSVARGRTELERLADVDGRLFATLDAVFAVGFQGRIAALSIADGRMAWSREMSSYQGMAAADRELYVSDAEGNVWALAQNTGGTLWRQTALRGRGLTAPVVQGDALVVGDYDGYLHWISREDGHFVARARVMDPNEAFPISDAHEGGTVPKARGERNLLAVPAVAEDLIFAADRRGALSAFRVTEKDKKE